MESFLQDLRYALRACRRSPGFTLVAIATLGLGIGVNSAIFSAVDGVLLRPLPYAEPERLFRVAHLHAEKGVVENDFSPQDFDDLAADLVGPGRPFSQLAAWFYMPAQNGMNLVGTGEPVRLEAANVSGGFFDLLGVPPAAGRTLAPADQAAGANRVAVISHRLWRSRFGGDPAIAGRKVTLDGEPFTIAGVAPAGFDFPAPDVDLWVPISLIGDDDIPHIRSLRWMEVAGRLAPGAGADQARAAVDAVFARLAKSFPESNREWDTAALVPLREALVGSVRPALLVLLAAVALVLLIACANLANLLLARAARRGRELAVRSAIGAGRGRLARQLLTESLLLALAGGAAGLGLAVWGVEALSRLAAGQLPRPDAIRLDPRVILFTFVVATATGLLAGLLPALKASRFAVVDALKEGGRGGALGRGRARAALVVVESALAVVLLVAAGLLLRSFWRLVHVDPGFRPEGVLAASISLDDNLYPDPQQRFAFRRDLLRRLREIPGVVAAGASKTMPLSGGGEPYGVEIGGREVAPAGGAFIVTPGYFEALGVPLLAGRGFDELDGTVEPIPLVVNRAFARQLWPGVADPVGRTLGFGDNRLVVIGMAADVRHDGLARGALPAMYVPAAVFSRSTMKLFVRTAGADPMRWAGPLREAVHAVAPDLPVSDVAALPQMVAGSVARPRLVAALVGLFGALAALLAALGLYGVVSYAVGERTHEIGIRMALGAGRGAVLRLVVGQGTALAALGVAAGLAASLAISRLLASQLFGVSPGDPAALAAAGLLLLLAALAASWVPAHRASRVDPVEAIRYE